MKPTVSFNGQSAVIRLEVAKLSDKPAALYSVDEVLSAFTPMLVELLEARIDACFDNLIKNQDSIINVNGCCVSYVKNGYVHHYTYGAAEAMRTAIEKLQAGFYQLTSMEVKQTLKALYWSANREDVKGIPFQVLVNTLYNLYGNSEVDLYIKEIEDLKHANQVLKEANARLSKELEKLHTAIKAITDINNK